LVLFGATGMIGQGALRESLRDERVSRVLAIGRTSVVGTPGCPEPTAKLTEALFPDLSDLSSIADQLTGWDACLFCLGVSSAGMGEEAYRRITYDITVNAARLLLDRNPELRFLYISGQGTNTQGRAMWARVKGATEDALLALSPRSVMFRPGFIQPLDGIRSRTRLYSIVYGATRPLWPGLRRLFPNAVTTTRTFGRAMLRVSAEGAPKPILDTRDINEIGAR
jgi:uncharacterized protein YbjT (DUF2867 family)